MLGDLAYHSNLFGAGTGGKSGDSLEIAPGVHHAMNVDERSSAARPLPPGTVNLPFIVEKPVEPAPTKYTISVYLDDGRVYDYDVSNASQAREHSAAIIAGGYRSVQAEEPNILTHYPPHRITKVKVVGNQPVQTNYTDRVRGT